jgi:hypothetical protein
VRNDVPAKGPPSIHMAGLKGKEITKTKERPEVQGSVRSERGSTLLGPLLNPEPDFRFSSGPMPNFGLNFGPVHRGSGPNRGSGPDCGITNRGKRRQSHLTKPERNDDRAARTLAPAVVQYSTRKEMPYLRTYMSSLDIL